MLPGGYDPYGVAEKTVYMLDAYTGKKIFQTTNSGSIKQDFPFAALPAPLAWGTSVNPSTIDYNKGYFDTALIGDLGGQIWTIRFNDVGQGYPAGLVNNWFLGRAFRQFSADDSGAAAGEYRMQHRNPFFQMAAVTQTDQGYMRAFLGSGDRANMGEQGLGNCSLYNPLACGKQECKVMLATNASIGSGNPAASGYSSFKGDLAATYTSTSTNSFTSGAAVCAPASTVVNGCVDCGSGIKGSTVAPSPNEPQYACANPGGTWNCSVRPISPTIPAERLEVTPPALSPDPNTDIGYNNRVIGVNIFDSQATPRSIFTTAAGAATYDSRALTESSAGMNNLFPASFTPTTSPTLAPSSNGSAQGFYFNYPALDERTATNAVLLQSCLVWYTMQPGQGCAVNADCPGSTCNTTTHECVVPTGCGVSASYIQARSAYLYQVNTNDGSTNCGLTQLNRIRTRAPINAFIVPPPPPQPLISINSKGQVDYGVVTPVGQVSPPAPPPSSSGLPFSFFYTLELPRELHQCRHPQSGGPAPLACYP
jgi:type IV pilus assembly protein PilY1